ncbi:MAG: hypothetical protein JXO49_02465 [Deltaproteobacteria bacterium]|nr:hypothetical protein [Candidatus Anaeroferrophillus wilburensis]MBN2888191.1 hypothetical protein [Deltaproteobacteria bacterium]
MTDQDTATVETGEPEKKPSSRGWIVFLSLIVLFVLLFLFFWTSRFSCQISQLSAELHALKASNHRLTQVEDMVGKMELENRLQTIERSLGDISRLAGFFKHTDAKKAAELQTVVSSLESEKELLQKQLENFQQALDRQPEAGGSIPRFQAMPENAAAGEMDSVIEKPSSWWEKIVMFRLFQGR